MTGFGNINDQDVVALARIAEALEPEYGRDDAAWLGSPFAWIRPLSPSTRGAVGKRLITEWLTAQGFNVRRRDSRGSDIVVNGHRIQIKFSTPWNGNVYKFQQIRDQDYDYMLGLAIAPFEAQAWLIPKEVLLQTPPLGGVSPQHGGADGQDTFWLQFRVGEPAQWMNAFGGSLSALHRSMTSAGTGRH